MWKGINCFQPPWAYEIAQTERSPVVKLDFKITNRSKVGPPHAVHLEGIPFQHRGDYKLFQRDALKQER